MKPIPEIAAESKTFTDENLQLRIIQLLEQIEENTRKV